MHRLGGLEAEVMNELWSTDEPQSVHDLVDRLRERRELAYTTILTVVTHLYEKGWVRREKRSRAYFYSPSRSREEATSEALRALLDGCTDPSAVLLRFAKTVSDREYDALRRGWTSRTTDQ
ncbi:MULTISPECIES: BlaI/MecI/CopY family transcriptional regulator [Rhodococcus]|uniref:BlaI/MecI/CopY family transcriptional regulator n=2 Tax=Rhodococcus pyridinivorans TaxID=103816 RepID=A0A7M2XVK1_9NOCA|nr:MULTISPECIES: BlaI/MecI/CopY family transcriptional regulator [Rhodococcus]AWZ22988.1 penicillinase repressor [Rhodococcus pyridinivorans]EHK80345.1 putative BlaI family transcriptional regulator [Rhodococcus pyridinivorans AK37]KHJ71803.1 penicillinase repressor [Rhodococcus sp. Chr-9]MCD2140916.1 BlaI/MecI/CopY family transcriptional regulator [Rhodococcus pyridinivorans]QOW01648.1 BlaI/MecI/CopY family transcriptional regulator [Rhodococcus pyridinivorans]